MSVRKLKFPAPPDTAAATDVIAARASYLREVTLFAPIRDLEGALQAFAEIMEERVFPPQHKIIEEGTSAGELYVLVSGKASVYKATPQGDPFKVAILDGTQHTFFGESGLIDSTESRSATIESDTECHCLVLNQQALESLATQNPHWVLPFYRSISSVVLARLRKTNQDLLILYHALIDEIRGH